MAMLESLTFKDLNGSSRLIKFVIQEMDAPPKKFQTTIITGRNGSHKSTLLRELVAGLTVPDAGSSIQFLGQNDYPLHVVCASGSVADRFPSKELQGRGNSVLDVPNYAYLGQRVGSNLLSKKRPLETFLTFALDEAKANRFSWEFFDSAHKFAGIKPHVVYDFIPRRSSSKSKYIRLDILGTIQALANGKDSSRERPWPYVSKAMADWLLNEFRYEDFNELEHLITSKGKKIRLYVGNTGAVCETTSNATVRLGILTNLLSLSDATVHSRSNSSEFSIFDLSSGEYHMYTSVLGLGFGMSNSSVVLIDEPENSLHPHWQQEFMDLVFRISSQALEHGHILVCTHSPLIVSAALDGSTILDLTDEVPAVEVASFGASSDDVLLSQFGIGSSRNRLVVDKVQRAVSIVERGGFNSPELIAMTPELTSIRLALRSDDPLVDVIDALLG